VRVLLSGAHGLIGSALMVDLKCDGHSVVTLSRSASPGVAAAEETVGWDPNEGAIDRAALRRAGPFEAVVHLAGAGIGDHRWSHSRKSAIIDSRILSTRLLVSSIVEQDPRPSVLVGASAVGVYGDRGDEVLTERSSPGDGFLADLCRRWEAECGPAAEAGMRVVNLRSGIVLSEKGGALRRQLPLFRFGLGGRLGNGRQYVSWIVLSDEIRILRRVLEDREVEGPLNSTAPNPVTNSEFTRALGGALSRPTVMAVPRSALAVALGAEMVDEMVLASQRVIPEKLVRAGHRFDYPDLDGALASVLG
jgi:uncharacterized protein